MNITARPARRTLRRLAILCLALTALPILSETASAQRFGGRGYGRGGYYGRGYRGGYVNRGFYRGYPGYGYGGGGYYSSGYNGFVAPVAPAYSPFYGGMLPNSLASPFVTPNVVGGYGGFN